MLTETWFGLVQTPRDAYLLIEACRMGVLSRVTRRLTDLERSQVIRPGAVFIFEEKEAGIRRWTDHVRWSPSRVSGAFLIYSELLSAHQEGQQQHTPLYKQSFSSTTLWNERYHLIAYYDKEVLEAGTLMTPGDDPRLRGLAVPQNVYPDPRTTAGPSTQPAGTATGMSVTPSASSTSATGLQRSAGQSSLGGTYSVDPTMGGPSSTGGGRGSAALPAGTYPLGQSAPGQMAGDGGQWSLGAAQGSFGGAPMAASRSAGATTSAFDLGYNGGAGPAAARRLSQGAAPSTDWNYHPYARSGRASVAGGDVGERRRGSSMGSAPGDSSSMYPAAADYGGSPAAYPSSFSAYGAPRTAYPQASLPTTAFGPETAPRSHASAHQYHHSWGSAAGNNPSASSVGQPSAHPRAAGIPGSGAASMGGGFGGGPSSQGPRRLERRPSDPLGRSRR